MDIIKRQKIREWALLGLVGTMALVANLPRHLLDRIGVEAGLMMGVLGLMVVLALFLYVNGLEPKKRKQNPEAIEVLLNTIERGNISYVRTVLSMNFDLDTLDDQGTSPLMRAARRGDLRIVEMLVKSGASPAQAGPSGKAADIALQNGFPMVSQYLLKAEASEAAKTTGTQSAPPRDDAVVVA